ncbi:MAG: hypothetical protein IKA03_02680, partial [Alphaproteobacteria bacterium]|nr:hypothetical protein [Alphaproteobacteria bacterium]
AADTKDSGERKSLMDQFNAILTQINDVAKDSGYKGVNLLTGGNLDVKFNETGNSKLQIQGVKADTTVAAENGGLGIAVGAGWDTKAGDVATAEEIATQDGKIKTAMEAVDKAIATLRTWSSEFGNNYSIVQSREEFTENLINVLTEGADKLTLADMNEESANMLALQTRQQLAINSLSLASQAAQSVLSLF